MGTPRHIARTRLCVRPFLPRLFAALVKVPGCMMQSSMGGVMSGAQINNLLGNSSAFIYFGKRRYIDNIVEHKFMCLTHGEAKQMEMSVWIKERFMQG